MRKPRIAVILDENTSGDGPLRGRERIFQRAQRGSGPPFGIPYLPEIVRVVLEESDGPFP